MFPNNTKGESSLRKNRGWEFLCTYHSCELAYFNPSMTVLYIWTPLARLNKGANAVVLEVNCFKVCLSAMMKLCVRVKCDDWPPSVPPLSRFLSRSSRWIVFLGVFSVTGERTRRSLSCVWSFFFEKSFVYVCPLFLLYSFCSRSFSLSLREWKSTTLWRFITSSYIFPHCFTHTTRVFVAIYCFYYTE